MAEQISTIIDESKLVGGEIINEQIIESKKEEVNKNKDEQIISETIIDESKLVGGEEIKALRRLAMNRMGEGFDIKEFHSKILENGSIPLNALRKTIEFWIESKSN